MIQIAQHVSAEIFVTVSSTEKRDLMKDCGIKDDHIFNSRDLSFTKGINRMTNGQGVDVVINTLTGEALEADLGLYFAIRQIRRAWEERCPGQ